MNLYLFVICFINDLLPIMRSHSSFILTQDLIALAVHIKQGNSVIARYQNEFGDFIEVIFSKEVSTLLNFYEAFHQSNKLHLA